jgi:hypothetical protein
VAAEVIPPRIDVVPPGTIVRDAAGSGLYVQTGKGVMELGVVQLALYYIVDARNFYLRAVVQEGERLG